MAIPTVGYRSFIVHALCSVSAIPGAGVCTFIGRTKSLKACPLERDLALGVVNTEQSTTVEYLARNPI